MSTKSNQTLYGIFTLRPRLKIYEARRKLTLIPELNNRFSIYSYAWCFAKNIGKGRIIFNSYHYSHTTSNHQSIVRWNVFAGKRKPWLTVETHCSLSDLPKALTDALNKIYEEMFQAEISLNIPRRKRHRARNRQIIRENLKKIERIKTLGFTLTQSQIDDIKFLTEKQDRAKRERIREIFAEVKQAKIDAEEMLNNSFKNQKSEENHEYNNIDETDRDRAV